MARSTSKIKLALKILITLGIFSLLFQRMDIDTLKEASKHVEFSAWGIAIICLLAQLFFLSWRWMLLINIGRPRMGYATSLQVTLASNIANLLLIPTIGGVVVRVAVALQFGSSLFKALFATAIDRVMTLAALSILCAIFLPALSNFLGEESLKDISVFIATSLLIVFVIFPITILVILPKLPEKIISKANIRSGVRYLTLLFNNNILLLKILIISLLGQMCFFLAAYCIAQSAGIDLTFLQMMIVMPAIAFISSTPLSFGGWGVREGAFVYGFGLLSINMEIAFSASVQIGIVSLIATTVAGVPALLSGGFLKKLKAHKE
jgi:uncharacterized membrane protein YbhN (UPF0104 family)